MNYQIIHNPAGKGNPYVQEPEERVPCYPSCRDKTVIGIITKPVNHNIDVYADVSINSKNTEEIQAEWLEDKDNYSSWIVKMPEAEAFDQIEYSLTADKTNKSGLFSYSVDGFDSVNSVVSCLENEDTLFLKVRVNKFHFWRIFDSSSFTPQLRAVCPP